MDALITTKVAPWVTIQEQFPRYHRTPASGGSTGFIDGLIEMYAACGGPVELHDAVEIGAWTGESSEVAAQMVERLTCVDPWEHVNDHEAIFDARMARFGNVVKLRDRSIVVAHLQFRPKSIDLVYIDGEHDYKHVRGDILAWLPNIKPGGWITGHDFDKNPAHAGVVEAVEEFLGEPDRVFTDSSWIFRKTPELIARMEEVLS